LWDAEGVKKFREKREMNSVRENRNAKGARKGKNISKRRGPKAVPQ